MTWALATVSTPGRETFCAALIGAEVREAPPLQDYPGLFEALQDWDTVADRLRGYDPNGGRRIADAQVLAPVRYPRTVFCSGPNFRDHLAEMSGVALDAEVPIEPFFFLKPPTTTVIGPDDAIVISTDPAAQVDWEAELGVVIGRGGRDIPVGRAREHVAGYTIVNDISARGPMHRGGAVHDAFVWDWLSSKSQDTFCPTGPGLTPEWLVPDPQNLSIRLSVNEVDHQAGSTTQMINSVDELVAVASAVVTLQPGDIIATGTPAGVGAGKGTFLRPGDTVEVVIDRLGRLRNPVVGRDTAHS
ncbi:fumarylacetoacetate hydrolase family protein [Nocardia pseudovaccinii]|uniref:fumarylacetoacetate hydrolase family protein n=1 Tax=Nocardia pseudovaccinii TaxID=189540 RepID=UPI000AC1C7DF|nr:fumarylacetoacetate hydrolase family protein [Nocardia pseudovaccinii]